MPQVKTPQHLVTAEKIVSFLEQEYGLKLDSHVSRALLVVKMDQFVINHITEIFEEIHQEVSNAQG